MDLRSLSNISLQCLASWLTCCLNARIKSSLPPRCVCSRLVIFIFFRAWPYTSSSGAKEHKPKKNAVPHQNTSPTAEKLGSVAIDNSASCTEAISQSLQSAGPSWKPSTKWMYNTPGIAIAVICCDLSMSWLMMFIYHRLNAKFFRDATDHLFFRSPFGPLSVPFRSPFGPVLIKER